ncbi:MAG: type I-E CRISPR-associated protein Cse1/CasA [Rhodococcus sp. (in: high G+C Gram-positive bacteria)]|uniref:type I-E CRISPR-associated protein Cse1/CasA n=1 Tax=Rhodococcus sp. TaxID=1831 RepID=UPI003BB6A900
MTASTAVRFNLIDEPWIPVRTRDGGVGERSIRSILCESSSIRVVSGDIPTQAFAIQRLLLAIVRRAIDWGRKPVPRWEQIWQERTLPQQEIGDYLDRVHDRFDLLDPTRPFYQVADFETAAGGFKPPSLLISDIPSGAKYFTTRAGAGADRLDFAEAARWVVHCQCFDPSGIKSGDPRDPRTKGGKGYPIGIAWGGQLGGVLFEGRNLFETLMLNTVLRTSSGSTVHDDDLPPWEREHPGIAEREDADPVGPVDSLTWQSRRIRLQHNDNHVVGVLVGNGDAIRSFNQHHVEFMTAWRFSPVQSKKFGEPRYFPRSLDPDRSLWRGLDALLADTQVSGSEHGFGAGVSNWIDFLVEEDILDRSLFVRPHALALEYINNSSIIGASIDDEVRIRVSVIGRGSELRVYATRAVQIADDAVAALVNLAGNLVDAAGGDSTSTRQSTRAQAFFALDEPYLTWLAELGDEIGLEAHVEAWQAQVRAIVSDIGSDLIAAAGDPAWKGRMVRDRWLDSSLASGFFWSALRKALPAAFDSATIQKGGTP